MTPTPMRPTDFANELNRALTTNSTASSFAALAPTVTEPTAGPTVATYVTSRYGNQGAPRYLFVMPFGAGADNATLSIRVVGRRKVGTVWVAYTLCELAATLSAYLGITGNTDLAVTDRVADTITITTGNANVDVTIVSPADDTPAHAIIDLKGCQKYTVQVKVGSATNGNALIAAL